VRKLQILDRLCVGMGLAVGMPSADSVFVTVIVNFQVVSNPLAVFVITQNGHLSGMMEVEER
jgi:hypothetical protein